MVQEQDLTKKRNTARDKFMSDEEIRMVDDLLRRIEDRRSGYGEYTERWDKEEEAYAGEQDIEENSPNTRVNIVCANIEGQVAALVEQNLAVACRGEGPSDQGFAEWGRIGLDWFLRKNHAKRLLDRHERRRELFGVGWFKLHFDPEAINGFGLPTVTCPPLEAMFVDGKVTDPLRLQEADYIAELMERSKSWAEEKYGDMVEAIHFGGSDPATIFAKEYSTDDEDIFWLAQVWTMSKPPKGEKRILRMLEMSDDGVLLFDSFKDWTGRRFKDKENPKPFYRYNRYPYFQTNMYYEEGKLFGFGDGKLLRPLQDMLNDLYDQARRAARPPRVLFDPSTDLALEDLMDNTDTPVPCVRPNENVRELQQKVNESIWRLLDLAHGETQRVIRWSELMLSLGTEDKTATEAAIQQQQGASGVDHKKLMLQETLIDLCEYALDMMMEHYTEGRAFRIDEDKEDYAWIDFRQMNEVPVMVPATSAFEQEWRAKFPDEEPPEFEVLKDKKGRAMTKSVDLDIDVTIGAGLPKNKGFLYQMLERLAKITALDKQGLPRPALYWEELRKFFGDFLGLPLEENEEVGLPMAQQPMATPQGAMPNATAQGLTAGGGVQQAAGGMR